MEIDELIHGQLSAGRVMQLATTDGQQPWCCTVYFVADKYFNLYWISTKERRHSQELQRNPRVAAAVPVRYIPDKDKAALQIEGMARLVGDPVEIRCVMRSYTDRYARGEHFYEDFLAGRNPHDLYRLTPHRIAVFDSAALPEGPVDWRAPAKL
jgi:uncharacterized protein YhbP (UPF0306 family)